MGCTDTCIKCGDPKEYINENNVWNQDHSAQRVYRRLHRRGIYEDVIKREASCSFIQMSVQGVHGNMVSDEIDTARRKRVSASPRDSRPTYCVTSGLGPREPKKTEEPTTD